MEENNEEIIILIEYIKTSPNREKVIKILNGNILKPSDISKETGVHINTVSKCLKQLREQELVRLLNPETKRGRLYKLTDKGLNVVSNMQK